MGKDNQQGMRDPYTNKYLVGLGKELDNRALQGLVSSQMGRYKCLNKSYYHKDNPLVSYKYIYSTELQGHL